MAIYRTRGQSNFTIINNTSLKDKRLSLKAKGLIAYMLSLPDDWVFYETELANHSTDGKHSVNSALKELQEAGYLLKKQCRDKSGKFSNIDWELFDEPQDVDLTTFTPLPEKPSTDNPSTEKPSTDNQTLLNTNTTNNLSIQSTNKTNATDSKLSASQLQIDFDLIWKDYPNRKGKSKAFAEYKKAIKSGVSKETVHSGVTNYAIEVINKRTAPEYVAHGSTWFNNKRWEDDYDIGRQYTNQSDLPEIPDTDELPF